jgi:hypothetical protein
MRWTLATCAVVAVIGAGCSNAPADTDTAATTRQQALKFSECMRANGVKEFPDPDASGQLTIDAVANGSSVHADTAAFKQALNTCKDLEPPGFTGAKRTAEQQAAALLFAQCIRDNGVRDFPDPGPDDPLVDTNRIPSAATDAGMSILNAAMHKCDASAAGVTGP